MPVQKKIDLKKVDWEKVDREKAEFFYREAIEHNDKLIEIINRLNGKAFSLLAFALSVLSAATGFLLSMWGNNAQKPIAALLLGVSLGVTIAVVLLLLAVFPRNICLSTGTPESYFAGDFYKADMHHLFSFGIAALNRDIRYNLRVMKYRSRFLFAGMLVLVATPIFAIMAFWIYFLNRWP
jgi:hypothetical protein